MFDHLITMLKLFLNNVRPKKEKKKKKKQLKEEVEQENADEKPDELKTSSLNQVSSRMEEHDHKLSNEK